MKKLNLKRLISILTIFTLSLGILCFAGCKTEEDTKTATAGAIDITNISSNGISLTKTSAVVVDDHLEQTLTASITGGDSNTKLVWELAWESLDEEIFSIENYLSITPSSDSRTCVVSCFSSYADLANAESSSSAIITVYVEGQPEIKATCVVTYLGYPDRVTVSSFSTLNEGSADVCYYAYERNLFDILPCFDASIPNVDISVSGSVTALCTYYDASGNAVESKEVTRSSTDAKSFDLTIGSNTGTISFERYFNAANYIRYNVDEYSFAIEFIPYLVTNKFHALGSDPVYEAINGVLTDYDLTFTVKITEPISGVSSSFSFKLIPIEVENTVTAISLDKSSISF